MLGDYAGAAGTLQHALEIRQDSSVYTNLGTLYFFQGLYTQARAALEKALELGANEYLVWGNLGDVYRFLPDHEDEAREAFVRAHQLVREEVAADPGDTWLRGLSAEYLAKQGDTDAARAELQALAASPKISADAWYDMAQTWEVVGDREAALGAAEQALRNGYGTVEFKNDPEFTELRKDVRYHRLMIEFDQAETESE
jgi:serine/threonine-protein kinase